MRIDEVFDKPQPIQWKWKGQGTTSAFFKVDDTNFRISFFPNPYDAWTVTFGSAGKHYYQAKKRDASTDYKHKTVLIFSTVLSAIDIFFNEQKPKALYFAASADRQGKMYDRLVKYINSTNPEYHIEQKWDPAGEGDYYEITK